MLQVMRIQILKLHVISGFSPVSEQEQFVEHKRITEPDNKHENHWLTGNKIYESRIYKPDKLVR